MARTLVIVESPTKAKTLGKFLGKDYIVESSVGHVRDLPASASDIPDAVKKEKKWATLGVDVENDFEPLYLVSPEKKKVVAALKRQLKGCDRLLLATDEDREGEAISWHLLEVLKPTVPVSRMVFHEITRDAILAALDNTRELDNNLVRAQEARRIIDRLVGYELSPVLWRKILPRLSAGRVQSVAIRLIVERERARMSFKEASWWDLVASLKADEGGEFSARLVSIDGTRLAGGKDFDPDTGRISRDKVYLLGGEEAEKLRAAAGTASYSVLSTEEKPFKRSPAPPFTTSTLQQEGGRKLGFDARRTMRAAQRLYELGFITYMRTDSVALAPGAVKAARATIGKLYGKDFVPDKPRTFANKVKNAQEAHEAIRPSGDTFAPVDELRSRLGKDEARLYEMIWKRTMACQMTESRGRRMVVKVSARVNDQDLLFQANGNVVDFPGFLRVYVEGSDDPEAALSDREVVLPSVKEGDSLALAGLDGDEHSTQPPARLTEASLVKLMEESGIGRPSTYASVIANIERREYTFKKGTALVPTFTAFAVVQLLQEHFSHLIDTSFTAGMEDRLDSIARGEGEATPYLHEFYYGNGDPGLRPLLDEKIEDIDPRKVCSISMGSDEQGREYVIRAGRYGPYVQLGEETASLPDDVCPDEVTLPWLDELLEKAAAGPVQLGEDPETGKAIYMMEGRFGPYVQLGDQEEKGDKPPRASPLPGMDPATLSLEQALQLLALPRTVGADNDGVEILGFNGRYGPYIKRGGDTRSLEDGDDLLKLSLERALHLLSQPKRRGRRKAAEPLKVFENVEALEGGTIKLLEGRFGPYVTDGETNASLPRDSGDAKQITEARAVQLILDRRASGPARKKKKKAAKKKAKKKTTKKKATRKKATKKKASAGKSTVKATVRDTTTADSGNTDPGNTES
jgi:DNA topoisomerase-1